jgi:protein-tyrosine phosphatase
MTDLHCHILPGMDDGAKDATVSLELLRKEHADGVDRIALTSHFNSERTDVETFLARRAAAYACLREALEREPMQFTFKLGAEVYFSPKLCELDVQALCMQDTAYLLLEFPTTHRPHFIRQTLQSLRSRGVIPLLAHVERYPYVMNDPQLLYEWVAAGAYAQINAGALLDAKLGKKLLKWIQWDLVHVLSTDAHSPDKRPPKLGEAVAMLEKKLGSETARRIVNNGDELFADQELNTSAPHQPRKVLGMWV